MGKNLAIRSTYGTGQSVVPSQEPLRYQKVQSLILYSQKPKIPFSELYSEVELSVA